MSAILGWNLLKAQWRFLANAHPLAKGCISYAIIWPTGCLIQQTIEGKNIRTYDYMRCLRFGIYGALYVAPSLYGWVRLTSHMWPYTNLRTGITKAITEQLSYGPFASFSFFFCMSLLEGKSVRESTAEVQDKFWPTYKTGICVWPVLQTINFSMVPERNRVVFVSICSLLWTTYLAYMKTKDIKKENESETLVQKDEEEEEDIEVQALAA